MNLQSVLYGVMLAVFLLPGWIMPTIVQSTLPFGVRIPPERVHDERVLLEKHRYRLRMQITTFIIAAMWLLISLADLSPSVTLVWFNALLLATPVFSYAVYYVAHRSLHRFKIEHDWLSGHKQVLMADTAGPSLHKTVSLWWALPATLITAATFVAGILYYPHLPQTLPIHFRLDGTPDGWARKSAGGAFALPVTQLLLLLFIVCLHLIVRRVRIELDPADPDGSRDRQNHMGAVVLKAVWAFIALMDITFAMIALSTWGIIHPGVQMSMMITLIPVLTGLLVVFWATWIAGRSNNFTPRDSVEIHRDDDTFWRLGSLYVNRDDPKWMVPKRFGVGWTLNFAHPVAWVFLIAIVLVVGGGPVLLTKLLHS